jgi:hypothetical protein
MTERILTQREATLTANAKRFKHDPHLDPIADAMDRGDADAWTRFHPVVQDRAGIYRDFRNDYREAVKLGLIDPDPA